VRYFPEKLAVPEDEMQGVDAVDRPLPLIQFALDPVAVEVSEDMIYDLSGVSIMGTLVEVAIQKRLTGNRLETLFELAKVLMEIVCKGPIELFA
jgi:hypothetical protein